jgi:hypothetical protein
VRPPAGGGGLAALLAEAEASGAQFLVIPATAYERVHGAGRPAAALGAWTLVTHQRHLCEIYEASPDGSQQDAPAPAGTSAPATGDARGARPGFWHRIRNLFRNR